MHTPITQQQVQNPPSPGDMMEEWECTVWTYLPRGGYSEVATATGPSKEEALKEARHGLIHPEKMYKASKRYITPFVEQETITHD